MAGGGGLPIDVGPPFSVQGVEFVPCGFFPPGSSRADRFYLCKPEAAVAPWLELVGEFAGGRMVEVGVMHGASSALALLHAAPERLVTLDIATEASALDDFIAAQKCDERLRPYWGIDQGDRESIEQILDDEFGSSPLDLVIDDASHRLALTRATFDIVFPRLRPGGAYVIEDWVAELRLMTEMVAQLAAPAGPDHDTAAARFADALGDPAAAGHGYAQDVLAWAGQSGAGPAASAVRKAAGSKGARSKATPRGDRSGVPMANVALELVLAAAFRPDVIASVVCHADWIEVRRGDGPVGEDFALTGLYRDELGLLGQDA